MLERPRHAKTDDADVVLGQQDVARVERAVDDVAIGRVIERFGELAGHTQRFGRRRGAGFTHHDVERIGGHEILREVRGVAVDAGRARRGNDRMLQLDRDQLFKFAGELMNALGRKIEAEQFDRNESIANLIKRANNGSGAPFPIWWSTRNGPKASGGLDPAASVCSRNSCQ
jgi:hypothetical protein